MDLVFLLGLLHKIFMSLSILISGLCMFYHNFYCTFTKVLGRTNRLLSFGTTQTHSKSRLQKCFFCAGTCLPNSCVATMRLYSTYGHTDLWEAFMKHAVETGSGAMIYMWG
jgi:hypothetical protein